LDLVHGAEQGREAAVHAEDAVVDKLLWNNSETKWAADQTSEKTDVAGGTTENAVEIDRQQSRAAQTR
jgi:hypothetical protein